MEEIQIWLKTTLLGIIILGTAGSLAAAFVVYFGTRIIPRVLGFGKTHMLNHKQVYNKIFAKRQHHLIITYFMYHMTYIVCGAVFGATSCYWAFSYMYNQNTLAFSGFGIFLLSIGFLFLGGAIYHSYFIERAYREKVIPHLEKVYADDESTIDNG